MGNYRGIGQFLQPMVGATEKWWLATGENLVPYIRHRSADFVNDATITSPAGGRTYLYTTVSRGINQDGLIRRLWIWIITTGGAAWKFKVFRPNGANYDFVGEVTFTPSSTGLVSFDFVTPISCQPGDKMAIYVPAGGEFSNDNTGVAHTYNYADGDIVATNAFATQVTNKSINIAAYGYQPFLVATGDSIFEGHNTASNWHSTYDSGPAGTATSEIWNQMRAAMAGLEYQNYAYGSQTYNWTDGTGFKEAFTTYGLKAMAWILGAGVNDVATGRAWADVNTNLDSIRTRCTTGDLWICEILPCTAGTDGNAATLRTFNANIAAWCAANSAHLIQCHDAMGQVRPSTGELDDLLAAYDFDGVHLTQAGVNAYAAIIKNALRAVYA